MTALLVRLTPPPRFGRYRGACLAAAVLGVALFSARFAAAGTVYNVDETTTAAFGILSQAQVGPNGNGGVNNYCAPTATMNSFTFLSNEYPNLYGNSLMGGTGSWLGAAQLLAGPNYMNTDPNAGTTNNNWITGKVNYINTFAPAANTLFEGMDSLGTAGQPWLQNANPTAAFLLSMLQQGEDVELALIPTTGIGHVLTLSSIHWNDVNSNLLFDNGDTLTIDGIDPAGAAVFAFNLTAGNPMTVSANGGALAGYSLVGALAESPEPASLVLLIGAGAALAVLRPARHAPR
jgi:hypothetical protein